MAAGRGDIQVDRRIAIFGQGEEVGHGAGGDLVVDLAGDDDVAGLEEQLVHRAARAVVTLGAGVVEKGGEHGGPPNCRASVTEGAGRCKGGSGRVAAAGGEAGGDLGGGLGGGRARQDHSATGDRGLQERLGEQVAADSDADDLADVAFGRLGEGGRLGFGQAEPAQGRPMSEGGGARGGSIDHDGADRFSGMHQVEAFVDAVEGQDVSDHAVDLDLAVHVPVDDLRHVGAAACAPESSAFPDAAGDQLEGAQPRWVHSSASRITLTLPVQSKE